MAAADDFDCPKCEKGVDSGDIPDHWSGGADRFEYECSCGATFTVFVDWSPNFYVDAETLKISTVENEHA